MCALGRKRQRLPKVGAPHPSPSVIGSVLESDPPNAASSTPGDIIALLSPSLLNSQRASHRSRPLLEYLPYETSSIQKYLYLS